MPKNVTTASFKADVLENSKPVLVDFWAEWCGPCRMIAPVLDAIEAEHGSKLEIVKVNVDEQPELAMEYKVTGIPLLGIFQNGELVKQIVGAKPKNVLEADLAQWIG